MNEIPYLAELDEKMKDKGVQVIGVVMDAVKGTEKDEEGIKKAQILAEKTKAEYPFLLPDSGYMNGRLAYVQAFPETFFVDKNGNIVGETYSGTVSYTHLCTMDWAGTLEHRRMLDSILMPSI